MKTGKQFPRRKPLQRVGRHGAAAATGKSPGKRFVGSLALALAPGPLPVPKACPAPGTAVEEEAVMQSHHYFIFLLKELVQDKWAVPSPAAA